MKFFKHQHGLSVVGIEFRAIFATVIGNTADVLWLVGCKNASRLSGSAVTIEIKHLNGSIFLDIDVYKRQAHRRGQHEADACADVPLREGAA